MGLRLQIVSRHRQALGERGIKEFGSSGGTIGRSLESDWVLPDGQRFISSRHASIDFRSGSYYIIDTSTNGVYVNGAEQPVGRGNPQRLFSGDRVRMGDYEMLVEIDEIDSTREQLGNVPHVDPVDLRQRVEVPAPTGRDLVDAFEVTGVGIEIVLDQDQADTVAPLEDGFASGELSLVDDAPAAPAPAAAPKASPKTGPKSGSTSTKPKVKPKAAAPATPVQPPATASKTHAGAVAPSAAAPPPPGTAKAPALDAFFRGAGMHPKALDERQAEQALQRLGQLMREMIVGLTENLNVRSTQKSALKQSNTTIQPRDNNALKFSAGVDEAMSNLLFRPESEQYLNAVEAVREAFGDIKAHQQILMNAMQSAIRDYVARLDPEHLEEKFSNGRHGMLIGAANKLKYWDLYKDLYQVIAQQDPGELPQVFLEEVARAYESEASRLTGPQPGRKLKVSAG